MSGALSAIAAVVVAVLALSAPIAVGAQTDAEAERDEVRQRRDAVVDELDVLQASDDQIDTALDELDDAITAQRQAVADAENSADEAAQAVELAELDLRDARRDVDVLEQAIAEMAIASFMHPPTADLVQSLQAHSLSDAVLKQEYLDSRAKRDVQLLDLLEVAEATAVARAADLEVAAADAQRAVEGANVALGNLRQQEVRQMSFADNLRQRIDASLAEAAVLAELDADLAAQIQAEQAALIARIPPPPPPEPIIDTSAAPTPPTAVPPTVSAPTIDNPTTTALSEQAPEPTTTTTRPAPTTTLPRTTTTTAPPVVKAPPVNTSIPPLRTVQGITVHASLADDLGALLAAAAADGVTLSGWGYRNTDRQIELRVAHCGPTYYDIWVRSASTCRPPTAVPGRSMHEQGRAIDFTYAGRTITSRSNPGFAWLSDNAATYGLFNLPSEPWHWSTTGS